MTRKEFFIQICEYLHEFTPLNEFKFSASLNEFKLRFPGGWQSVNMAPTFWSFLDVFDISPYFDIRFDVAQRWFEKFGYRDVKSQRADGLLDFEDFPPAFNSVKYEIDPNLFTQQNLLRIQKMILDNTSTMCRKCYSLTSFFENFIIPVIEGNNEIGTEGNMEHLFYYSAICWIVSPENFPLWKKKADSTAAFLTERMNNRRLEDPLWSSFAYRYDEIMDYLVHYDFSKELARLAPERR